MNTPQDEVSEDFVELEVKKECAIKIQAHFRRILARHRIIGLISARYEKIFDPKRGRYYYYDTIRDQSSWSKPLLLRNDDIKQIAPTYTPDQAAMMIQRQLWRRYALIRTRILYKNTVVVTYDESVHANYYFNPKTERTAWDLPIFMGGKVDHGYEKMLKKKVKRKKRDDESEEDSDDEDEEEDDSDDDSELSDPDALQKRRQARKYPRSKVQGLVDLLEDTEDLVDLDLTGIGAKKFTSRIYDLDKLKSLMMANNRLRKLSADVQYFVNLQVLDVSKNFLTTVPDEIEELTKLRVLNLAHNRITAYSGRFYKLGTLEELDLSFNPLKEIPVEVGNLELLKEVHEWEVGIGLLTKLTALNISGDGLSKWPPQAEKLTRLVTLNIAHNDLERVPDLLALHVRLNHFDASHNRLQFIPSEIYDLPLQVLLLNNNKLYQMPLPIESLAGNHKIQHLRTLDVSFNDFLELPDVVSEFPKLSSFRITNNKISRVHEGGIGSLTSLTHLDMSHNSISELPASFGNCKNLRSLNLSDNELTEMVPTMSQLKHLEDLNFSHNKLTEASGKVFALLSKLVKVNLSHNLLPKLPVSFYTLKRLECLDCSHNKITSFHDRLGQLTSLTIFYASHNNIREIPAAIGELPHLRITELHNNQLSAIPESISAITTLTRVSLHHNKLRVSPAVLFLLPALLNWDISWNLKIKGHYVDWKRQDSLFDITRDAMPVATLTRQLVAAWGQLAAVSDYVEPPRSEEGADATTELNSKLIERAARKAAKAAALVKQKLTQAIQDMNDWHRRLRLHFAAHAIPNFEYEKKITVPELKPPPAVESAKTKEESHQSTHNLHFPHFSLPGNFHLPHHHGNESALMTETDHPKDDPGRHKLPEDAPRGGQASHNDAAHSSAHSVGAVDNRAADSRAAPAVAHAPSRLDVSDEARPDQVEVMGLLAMERRCAKINLTFLFKQLGIERTKPGTMGAVFSGQGNHEAMAAFGDAGHERRLAAFFGPHEKGIFIPDADIIESLDLGLAFQDPIDLFEKCAHEIHLLVVLEETRLNFLRHQKRMSTAASKLKGVSRPGTRQAGKTEDSSGAIAKTVVGLGLDAGPVPAGDQSAGSVPHFPGPHSHQPPQSDAQHPQASDHLPLESAGQHPPGSVDGAIPHAHSRPRGHHQPLLGATDGKPRAAPEDAQQQHPPAGRLPPVKPPGVAAVGAAAVGAGIVDNHDGEDQDDDVLDHLMRLPFEKSAFIDFKQFPRILHYPRLGHAEDTTAAEADAGGTKNSIHENKLPVAKLHELAFECYLGLGTALLRKADKFATAARVVERRGGIRISSINIAQRFGEDLMDLTEDLCADIIERLKAQAKAASKVGLRDRRKNAVAALKAEAGPVDMGDDDTNTLTTAEQPEDDGGGATVAATAVTGSSSKAAKTEVSFPSTAGSSNSSSSSQQAPKGPQQPPPEELVSTPPIPETVAVQCIGYLLAYRRQILAWAQTALDSAGEYLAIQGWDCGSPSFRRAKGLCVPHTALHLKPAATRLRYVRGRVLQSLGRLADAMEEYRAVKLFGPRFTPVNIDMVKTLLALGDFNQARHILLDTIMREFKLSVAETEDVLNVFKLNRLYGMLLTYANAHQAALNDVGVGSSSQRRSLHCADDGLLTRLAAVAPEITHGMTIKGRQRMEEEERVLAAKARHEAAIEDRELLQTQAANVIARYRREIDEVNSLLGPRKHPGAGTATTVTATSTSTLTGSPTKTGSTLPSLAVGR